MFFFPSFVVDFILQLTKQNTAQVELHLKDPHLFSLVSDGWNHRE